MSFSTSPYQNNDYQAASSYRPYRLPTNDIVKGLAAQDSFWNEGARRIKQYYDHALNLDLTLDQNRDIRKNFMSEADKQMAKLSSMNVADPSVQRQGIDVFKPLYQDKGILYDDYLSNKQQQIITDADRYKRDPKTQGEGYNTDNLMYALKPFEGFNSKTDRNALESIYGKAQNAEYTPYHDVSKEYLDIASKCKANKETGMAVNGLYFDEQSDNSLDASKLQGCIKSGLSDKAWQQLRITGSVRYGNNYGAVAQGYAPILQGNTEAYNDTILRLNAEKKKLKDAGKLTDEMGNAYDQAIGNYNSKISSNTVAMNKINHGDYSDIQKDYDNIVSQVYGNQDIGGFAQAFAYKDISHKLSANAAGIAQMREMGENARFAQTSMLEQQKFAFDQSKFMIEQQNKQQEMRMGLIKTLMGEGGKGGALGMNMDYQLFSQFVKPIYESLGIKNPEGINSFLDNGTVIKDLGETFDSIKNKANQFHKERLETSQGIANVLKDLGVTVNSSNTEDIYNAADKYLRTYDNTEGDNAELAGKTTEIGNLRKLVNQYTTARSNVFSFMKMRDQIQQKINSSPEVKAYIENSDKRIQNVLNDVSKNKYFFFFKDQRKGTDVHFFEKDLQQLATGTHPDYSFNKDGDLIYRSDGTPVVSGNRTGQDSAYTTYVGQQHGRRPLVAENNRSTMGEIAKIFLDRNNTIQPLVSNMMKDVVRNSNVYNVGNVPGLENTIKKQFSFIPEFNSSDYRFVPGTSYNGVTTVQIQQRREKKADAEDANSTVETWEPVSTKDVLDKMNSHHYAVGGSNDINVNANGDITVKTPYLPMYQNQYELSTVVNNEIYGATHNVRPLGNQEKRPVEIRTLPGGARVGFDVVGQGTDKPNVFRTWYTLPNGSKHYYGEDLYADNEVSNALSNLERTMPQILQGAKKTR